MINLHEITIGSYIQHFEKPDKVIQVIGIEQHSNWTSVSYFIEGTKLAVHASDLKHWYGIKLTEESLSRLGFVEKAPKMDDKTQRFKNFQLPENKFTISLCMDECDHITRVGFCYVGNDMIELEFVHQLQNYYRVLIKKELTFK